MTELTAVATYGRVQAGARVRVFQWLDRLVPEAQICSYIGTSGNSPRVLLRQPLATLAAERAVRTMWHQKLRRVLLFRQASPFGQGGVESRLLRSAGWGVYDFDDGLPWDGGRRSNPGNVLRSSASKCTRSVQSADRVIAGNDYLADWASQFARDVVVIPSCVDPSLYEMKHDYRLGDPPRLVWIGSQCSEIYVAAIEDALLQLHRRTGARLTVIGDATARFDGPLDAVTDRVPWREGHAEQQLAAFDIGLGPLTDDRFSRGKSAYKLLQYGAAGLPFVASDVGTNGSVTQLLGGRLAARPTEWVDNVVDLLGASADVRHAAGRSARAAVEASFSYDAWASRWLAALELPIPPGGADHPGEEHQVVRRGAAAERDRSAPGSSAVGLPNRGPAYGQDLSPACRRVPSPTGPAALGHLLP